MTIDEAIEIKRERIESLENTSKHRTRLYQKGVISKEQHNAEQLLYGKDILAEQLGIEALGKILLLRRTEINGQKVEPYTRLPSEGEKE